MDLSHLDKLVTEAKRNKDLEQLFFVNMSLAELREKLPWTANPLVTGLYGLHVYEHKDGVIICEPSLYVKLFVN